MLASGWWRISGVFCFLGALVQTGAAQGILLPTDPSLPALTLAYQRVNVKVVEQAAVTRIEQEFSNPSSQPIEATYIFPVPKGAGVDDFGMVVNGKRVKGELVEAEKARQIYTDIVRRLKDPGLLERMDDRLFRLRVFPVPANGRQRIDITYSEVLARDGGLVAYRYAMKTGAHPTRTEEDFTLKLEIDSSAPIKNIYSPTHAVGVTREGDRKAIVGFEQRPATLDRDFQLFWSIEENVVGLSTLFHRDPPTEDGYVLMLLAPSTELGESERVPRDIVFVLDSSGSMAGEKMKQAKGALEHCLGRLGAEDRFAIVRFATTTELLDRSLLVANEENRRRAIEWTRKIEATGGTAIHDAFESAFGLRAAEGRNFTIVFLTDGQPTIGVTDPKAILQGIESKGIGDVRIFSLGMGDDVNASLLDQVAEKTRGTSVYVTPSENIEVKVSSFYDKISHPVLADLSLRVEGSGIQLREMYPPKLPDLFHGGQLVVAARYSGAGDATVMLEGALGSNKKSFTFRVPFAEVKKDHPFVANLWAQRKVGYLLDQVRVTGEHKELVDEIVALAKKFGIVTPYTSYLVAPDERPPVVLQPMSPRLGRATPAPMLRERSERVFYSEEEAGGRDLARQTRQLSALANSKAREQLREQSGFVGVDNAQVLSELKNEAFTQTGVLRSQNVAGRDFQNVRGVWIDTAMSEKEKIVRVKYLSDAYFQIVGQNADARQILAQGERVVWRTPTRQTLVIDGEGVEKLSEMELKDLLGG